VGNVTIPLLEPYTQFENRLTPLDLRVTRTFRFGHARLQPQFDVYDVLNANTVLSMVQTYGASWLRPINYLGRGSSSSALSSTSRSGLQLETTE
jgi:hypothetical protein